MLAFILILYTCIVWFIYQWILMIDNIYFKCFNHFCVCECNPLILCLEDKLPKFLSIYVPEKKYTCTTDQLYFRREIFIGNAPIWIFEIWCNNFISELIPVNLHLKYLLIIISWNPQVILLYNFTSWFFIQIVFPVYFTQSPYTFLAKLLIIQWYDNSVCLYCHQLAHFSV